MFTAFYGVIPSTAVLVIIFIIVYKLTRLKPSSCLPPGPFSLPVVGTLPWLGADVREPLERLKRSYGDVFTVYLGTQPSVMLCSQEAIREAFVKYGHAFSGRPQDLFFIKELTKGRGLVSSEGNVWRQQRKFVHNVLREFGVGQPKLENRIQEELTFFLVELQKTNEQAFDPHDIIQKAVSNVICSIVYGSRYEYRDPVFIYQMELQNQAFKILGNAGVLTVFPFLRHIPGNLFGYQWLKDGMKYSEKHDFQMIEEHRKSATPGVVRDLIDAFLVEQEKEKDDPDSSFNDLYQLRQVIGDLFSAGTETTTTTLSWALIYLLHNPEIQDNIQREILDVIGPHRQPRLKDKGAMPYTEAFILETQRMGDIVPLGMPHTVTEDVIFRGYHLTKGVHVYSNLYSVHRDGKTFKDPYMFRPERFLGEDGKVYGRERVIPFSIGKRVCIGESMARMEIFLFLTSMLQRFTFVNPPSALLPDTLGILGITNLPKPFTIIAKLNAH